MTPKACHASIGDISMRFILLHLRRYSPSATSLPKKMVRVLNVAEKNDAAKSLANVLSHGQCRKREGFSRFNKIYEFEYKLMNEDVTMTMTSVSGHLLGLEFTGSFKKWGACNPVDLFSAPVMKHCPQDYNDIKRTLEQEIRGCQSLIIWTDCDREGENIGFEIIHVCQAVKPNIKVYRAKFSEITPQAITRAINNLAAPDARINDAVDVRQELDLRIAFTRFQTLRLRKTFPQALSEQLISYGSCQFPTLGFVVERYKQAQAFVPQPFSNIRVLHQHDEVKADFSWQRNRLCEDLYNCCLENPVATVIDIKSKSKSKWRPQALDTVELEKLASSKLKINAKETMKIAEHLYTQGFISYPRTETNIFPKEMDLAALVSEQTRDPDWGEFAQQVLKNGINPRNGTKTDQAHPPIHPLKYTATLQGNDKKVYEFIVRHFLACVSQDAQGHETIVDINIADEIFSAQGLVILAKNFLDVYPYDRWNAKEIPLYRQGDQFEPNSIEIVPAETSAPLLLTEADLISLMEKHGIGTDATHADHIETVKARKYVGLRPDGRFVPGQLGMGLVEGYESMGYEMSKPNLRAELEADLKLICEGRKTKEEVLSVQIQKYKEVFIEACNKAQKLDEALSQYLGEVQETPQTAGEVATTTSVVMTCSKCGSPMTLRTEKDNKGS
ncbi:DNA topoisomerase 3-alpha-like isoform X2 [Physella acuta]|uniref:DNA topoisomerase 3-alpha-like isoform X2 n=1 Tax=Physella acuta TaxID=109671 RepID=UPI0027DE841D|nr:DNA topoisomerase 3-alpha-like isoform X2 [Physella acuta]